VDSGSELTGRNVIPDKMIRTGRIPECPQTDPGGLINSVGITKKQKRKV